MSPRAGEYPGISGGELSGLGDSLGISRGPLLRRVFDSIIPVSVAQRFYGEKSGSVYGITAGTPLIQGERPAIEFFNPLADWAIHRINIMFTRFSLPIGAVSNEFQFWYQMGVHMFTPYIPYNPILNNTTPLFAPNLITNAAAVSGGTRGQGGSNPDAYPQGLGYILYLGSDRSFTDDFPGVVGVLQGAFTDSYDVNYQNRDNLRNAQYGQDKKLMNQIFNFDPPLRVLRSRTLDFQMFGQDEAFVQFDYGIELIVCLMYTELPNPRGQYGT